MPELGKATYVVDLDTRPYRKAMKTFKREVDRDTKTISRRVSRIGDAWESNAARVRSTRRDMRSMDKSVQDMADSWENNTTRVRRNTRESGKFGQMLDRLQRRMSIFNTRVRFFTNILRLLRWPSVIALGGLGIKSLAALTAGATSLAGALGSASGGLVAMASAFVPVTRLAFTATNAFAGLAQVVGTLSLGFSGIGDALGAMEDAQKATGRSAQEMARNERDNARAVRDAQRQLADSHRAVRDATEDLTRARESAREELQSLREESERTAISEERATISLLQARRDLLQATRPGDQATGLEQRSAKLAVKEAEQALEDARQDGRRTQEELAEAEEKGVRGSDQVIQARRGLAEANRQVAASMRGVRDAQRDTSQSIRETSTEVDNLRDAMADLPRSARDFVRFLFSLKPLLDSLRETAADGLLPGVEQGIRNALPNFESLEHIVGITASTLGGLAEEAGALLGSSAFGERLEEVGEANARILTRLGRAGIRVAEALSIIARAAIPLTEWLSTLIEDWSELFLEETKAEEKTGELAEQFDTTRTAIREIGGTVVNLGRVLMSTLGAGTEAGLALWRSVRKWSDELLESVESVSGQNRLARFFDRGARSLSVITRLTGNFLGALVDIGSAGRGVGMSLLRPLNRSARAFRDWTESAEGRNEIKQYFEDARPAIVEIGRIIRDITKAFVTFGSSDTLAPLLSQLRTDLIPAFTEVLTVTTETITPSVIDFMTEFANVWTHLAAESGAVALFFDILTAGLKVVNALASIGPVREMLKMVTVMGLMVGVGRIFFSTFSVRTIINIGKAFFAWGGIPRVLKGVRAAIAGLALTARAAMLTTGIGALIVGATLIILHWDEVKAFLSDVWDWMKQAASDVGGWLSGVWEDMKKAASKAFGLIAKAAKFGLLGPIPLIISRWGDIKNILGDIWDWIKGAARTLGNIVSRAARSGFLGPLPFIISRWGDILEFIKSIPKRVKNGISGLGKILLAPFNWVKDRIEAIVDGIVGMVEDVKDTVKDVLDTINPLSGSDRLSQSEVQKFRESGGDPSNLPGWAVEGERKARGGVVGRGSRGVGPRGTDTVPLWASPGEFIVKAAAVKKLGIEALKAINNGQIPEKGTGFDIASKAGKKLIDETKDAAKKTGEALTGELSKGHDEARDSTEDFMRDTSRSFEDLTRSASDNTKNLKDSVVNNILQTDKDSRRTLDRLRDSGSSNFNLLRENALTSTTNLKRGAVKDMGDTREGVVKHGRETDRSVTGSFRSMTESVHRGFGSILTSTNKALRAFGMDPLKFSVSKAEGRQRGGIVELAAGGIVPGHGSGDKVPVHVGGQLAAMTEPGELLAVVNRNAAASMMAANEAVPRFQEGGLLGNTGGLAPGVMRLASVMANKFGMNISPQGGLRPSDTDSLHSTGQAADFVGGDFGGASRYMNQIGPQLLEGIFQPGMFPGVPVSWDAGQQVPPSFWGQGTWDGHLDHIHAAISGSGKGLAAAIEKVKRVILEGPGGAIRRTGQGALDLLRESANEFIDEQMPTVTHGNLGVGKTGIFDKFDLRSLWSSVNPMSGDPRTMAAIGMAESSGDPKAIGHDPGGTRGLGLWQITTGFNDDLISKYGGEQAMLDPVNNAQAADDILERQGLDAWVVYNTGKYTDFLQKGGVLGGISSITARRDKAFKSLRRTSKRASTVGLPSSTVDSIGDLTDEAEKYQEYASNAQSISTEDVDGNEIPGIFKGGSETRWLGVQLGKLFDLRRKLIRSRQFVIERQQWVQRMVESARDRLKQISKAMKVERSRRRKVLRGIRKARRNFRMFRRRGNVRGMQRASATADALRGELRNIGARQNIRRGIGERIQEHLLPNLVDARDRLNSTRADLEGSGGQQFAGLEDVQGVNGPVSDPSRPSDIFKVGKFGGNILDTQLRLRELNAKPEAPESPATGELDEIKRLLAADRRRREIVESLQLPVFKDFFEAVKSAPAFTGGPSFGGVFHSGGIVPGRRGEEKMILAEAGEVVSRPESAPQPATDPNITVEPVIIVEDDAIDRGKIRAVYDEREQQRISSARRRTRLKTA